MILDYKNKNKVDFMETQTIGNIRCTEAEQISVIDLIKALGGYNNPEEIWENIKENNPDIAQDCILYSFNDVGATATPVTNRETALKIIDLLPDNFNINDWQGAVKLLQNQVV